jgi:predicted RNA binding protein YcfA (HicA-like mRNA interferase family)
LYAALEKAGFYFVRQKGSHIVMRRDEPYAQVIVPETKSLPPGTLRNIIRQTGLTVEEFLQLL